MVHPRAHRVRKHHDREDEPWSSLPDELLSLATSVVSRRSQIVQDNSSGSPEGNKREHGRGGPDDLRRTADRNARLGRGGGGRGHGQVEARESTILLKCGKGKKVGAGFRTAGVPPAPTTAEENHNRNLGRPKLVLHHMRNPTSKLRPALLTRTNLP